MSRKLELPELHIYPGKSWEIKVRRKNKDKKIKNAFLQPLPRYSKPLPRYSYNNQLIHNMAQGARGIEDAFRKGQHGGGIVIDNDNLSIPAQQKLSRDEQRKLKELEEGLHSYQSITFSPSNFINPV